MKILLLFEIFTALSNAQVQITCEYEFKDFSIPDGPIYACKILNDIQDLSYENRDVIEVHGVHLPNKNDGDIKGIWTENNYHLTYFPRKLTKRFSNLKVIHYNKSRFLILLEIYISFSSAQIEITCHYEFISLPLFDHQIYTCSIFSNVTNVTYKTRDITAMKGQHLPGKTNDDVKGFLSDRNKIIYPVHKLTKYFKNLEAIKHRQTYLVDITNEDFEEFATKLVYLQISKSYLEKIQKDLFIYNPNLKGIDLSNNRIIKFDPKVFDSLRNLEYLTVEGNTCIKKQNYDTNDVAKVINQIKSQCSDISKFVILFT
ncbi:hypothetical protein PVAND_001040 [Polypedilum vanderplanki]|uniref:Leucine rich repeat protein n=1 Tax=Polypedilum vanderplanki TaxID=319348 RepID=A0A9J6BM12_POLVA|nr:hypothetical protein PVAND_001040 [Polypedilum vanderplanki]